MIISYSNNFVVIRTPRAAGTSLAFYFFKSGLINSVTDIYKIEGSFASWSELDQYISAESLKFANLPKELKGLNSVRSVRRTFSDLVAKGAIPAEMPCVTTIRNPIERMASGYAYICKDVEVNIEKNNGVIKPGTQHVLDNCTPNVNMYWDYLMEYYFTGSKLNDFHRQCHYFPDHAEVFNIENLHQHASKFILEKSGVPVGSLRSKSISIGFSSVDITTDDDNGYQKLLDTAGKAQIGISFAGVLADEELIAEIMNNRMKQQYTDFGLVFESGTRIDCVFNLEGIDISGGASDAEVDFSGTLNSSGEWTFTAAAT